MPKIPSVYKNVQEPDTRSVLTDETGFKGDDSIGKALTFVSGATSQYAIEEKKSFDLARLTEARNALDYQEVRLSSDEKMGYQNKLGQNAFLFKDEDGRDFMQHYSDQFQSSISDVSTQLQLTPDQKKVFDEYAQKKAVSFNNNLMVHQLRQGKEYKVSVLEASINTASEKAKGLFTNPEEMNETLDQLKADTNALGLELGWSEAEKQQKIATQINGIHGKNLNVMLETGDFRTAEAYLNDYKGQMSQLQKISAESEIKKQKENYATNQIIQFGEYGMSGGSNPAFNSADIGELRATSKIDPAQWSNLKFDDPRLDSLLVLKAKEEDMEWAIPLVTALRVSGEKSNNNQVSPKGAKGVYQFMPIAIEQVKQITGKTIDPNNPEEATWATLKFVQWISKKYGGTKDFATIASFYNGGGNHIPQMKSGGVNAIVNDENRKYVNRILSFDFNEYAKKPVMKDLSNFDTSGFSLENQAKIRASEQRIIKQREDAIKQSKKQATENALDMIRTGQASFAEIEANKNIIKFLDHDQMEDLRKYDEAKRTRDYTPLIASVLQYPIGLKGKPQSYVNDLIENATRQDALSISKLYAEANGRTISDLKQAQSKQAGSKSLVTGKLVFDLVKQRSDSLGFSSKTGTSKTNTNATKSAQFLAIQNDIYEQVETADKNFLARNNRHMTEIEVRRYVNSVLGKTNTVTTSYYFGSDKKEDVLRYRNNVDRKQIADSVNNTIMKYVRSGGANYKTVHDVPEQLYWSYYYKAMRSNSRR